MRKMINECYVFMPLLIKPFNRDRIRQKAIRCRMIEEQSEECVENDDRLKKRRIRYRRA